MTDSSTSEGNIADAGTVPQHAPYGVTVTQVIRLPELIEFRADKRVRKKLFEGAQLWGEHYATNPDRLRRAISIQRRTSFS